jgi:hypothetical protein
MIAALLARFAPYKLIAELVVIGFLALYGAEKYHEFLLHERAIGAAEVQKAWDAQKAIDKAAAAKQEADWQARYNAAIQQGAQNAQALQTAATAAAVSSSSLRDTIATLRERLPSASAEASRAYASTLATLLGDCQAEYREVAQRADGHRNDAATLSAAWPTQPVK